jgi:para-nitrobenzyl esterase
MALAFLTMASNVPVLAQVGNQQVRIDSGVIEGAVSGEVLSFKGIRYAAPPVAALRWRAPQFDTPWSDVRSATAYGLDCMQKPIPGDAAASGGAFGEDCLFVNVRRPAATEPVARLPVLVCIHGGGFLNGGSSAPMFDGSTLARQGLVVVALN